VSLVCLSLLTPTVIGDDLARPQDVVTALLQDPLIADSEYVTSLYDRHVGVVEEQLVIR
jgi:hypothetical protein